MDFRPIFAALARRLEEDLGSAVVIVERRNLPATAFGEGAGGSPGQPALVVLATAVNPVSGTGAIPIHYELGATLVLHTRISGEDLTPDDQVLDLVSKIEAALAWREGEPRSDGIGYWTTLGGLVRRAWLEEIAIEDNLYDSAQVSTLMRVRILAKG